MPRIWTNTNLGAFLDTIAVSEIGANLLANSDDGYNVLVGGKLFTSYTDHPRILVQLRPGLASTAAGRYQLLARYFDVYKARLHLPDFGPVSQDMIAIQQIEECRAIDVIEAGNLVQAISLCAHIWASFPGNTYNQHTNSIGDLQAAYVAAGGIVGGSGSN
jgi:muramidase (phage lysozyme)